ncbi:biotin carboxylase N-terminal domain-containing protein [Haliea sp. E1-2-M8]|uniref:acetyl/propionyl/methylcrotonyl-CoA carboxylase subunit alpha n=1 Tax=Haliea sp. E1-2-M8 TaxID=3064706 RepID=UPI002723B293|nr:biotin carboxylase N-terminal domain-containing protein [Haliea sp. E1-2-M8]MDO8863602.1 biotin carboxylase N-terminal domain-containing protein [Haliea sp. E1-2-M8]
MAQFDSVLVANRGEIAVRVIRSAQAQGYRTIAVYSAADAGAPHVLLADAAVLIGPAPAKQSYLDPERILQAAMATRAGAIHPGYGFLSENAAFARACEDTGMVFIGPSAGAIELMGNKAAAKRLMLAAGVPCIPGYQGQDQSDETLLAAAQEIGAPLMVKAAAGGGGRGMRLVADLANLPAALAAARSEAENAFGSGELILEWALLRPRHVEIQVFSDSLGNHVHLGERDCSVQRRHQKVLEESPCPVLTPELRGAMGDAAVNAARSIDYCGAGTVEFLLDSAGEFYFLEMNTRLQVEHPVTEMVTGLDLVALQLQIAQGYPLPVAQADVTLTGHAIEARLYAEDTVNDFLPAAGTIQRWQPPVGDGIRVDHGLAAGQEVSPFYDPMLAKIIAWGEDRAAACRRLHRALQTTVLFGPASNRQFLLDVVANPRFQAGAATTAFIAEEFAQGVQAPAPELAQLCCAAVLQYRDGVAASERARVFPEISLRGWSGLRHISVHYRYQIAEEEDVDVYVQQVGTADYVCTVAASEHPLRWLNDDCRGTAKVLIDGVTHRLCYTLTGRGVVSLQLGGAACELVNQLAFTRGDEAAVGSGIVKAPMHGNVLQVLVAPGDRVVKGQELLVIEAMKMEHRLLAQVSGEVSAVHVQAGVQAAAGATVLEISES